MAEKRRDGSYENTVRAVGEKMKSMEEGVGMRILSDQLDLRT